MPIYTYQCPGCQEQFDVRRSFTDETPVACPRCGAAAQRVLSVPNLNTWKAKIVPPR